MEPEQRGRTSRASSTSSLGREVRCGCQYYQSDSLLPERRALLVRPSSRTMQQPPAVRCSEHEYEPISPRPAPSLPHPAMAPVVRITDTDVMPVADSDDSIDDRARLPPELILDGDVILPLDGKIEDSAMEGRELGETGGDTSEEQEPTAQQLPSRLEERFLDAPTPYTESRTDGEVNTSQVDSPAVEEPPLGRGARGLPQRLKTEAGKLRSRLRSIQRPKFAFPQRQKKSDKTTRSATGSSKSDKSRTAEKRLSRIDRIRTSISEKSAKFSLPDRPKFNLPDTSKFHLPERPKFNFPDKSRFHLPDKSKFTIKKPNIRLPGAFARVKRPPSLREQQKQHSTESTAGSKRNIFDFATYPRIFDKKSKKHDEYATSSPKESRAQSAESATFPRARKRKLLGAKWIQRFGDSSHSQDQDHAEAATASDSPPWNQASMEDPRLSVRTEEEIMAAAGAIPWEEARKREQHYDEEEIQYMDYEQESSQEISDRQPPPPRPHKMSRRKEKSYEHEEMIEVDPELFDDQETGHIQRDEIEEDVVIQEIWDADQQIALEEKIRPIPRSRSLDEDIPRVLEQEGYESTFIAVDPRRFRQRKTTSEEEQEEDQEMEEEEEREPSSIRSDREQQPSSGSSCDRRRRGVIEEIDSDEFFLRESGISQDENLGSYLANEIRDALRSEMSALQNDDMHPTQPQRPIRTRSLKKRKEDSLEESNEMVPPVRPKRERAAARRSREASIVMEEVFRERTRSDSRSDSRHRIVYQAEGGNQQESLQEPLDDIVVVKPTRRKSRSSLRSQSQPPMEAILSPSMPVTNISADSSSIPFSSTPPVVPVRRKRTHRETVIDRGINDVMPICNGHREWEVETSSTRPVIPARLSRSRQSLSEQIIDNIIFVSTSQENMEKLTRQKNSVEPTPVPPKRRSRSRTTSIVADEDRTSHGAESLPEEIGYIEEDILQDETSSMRDLSGYAIVEKREKPPRPPPPRRKRDKFATTPRPVPPKRPQRAYSTLGPANRSRPDTSMSGTIASDTITSSTITGMALLTPTESTPYIEIDSDNLDGGEHRDALRSGEVLNKIQGRPLPAPPRPPRARKDHAIIERPLTPFEFTMAETTAATQTDPLPDDMIIEEEITQAKLIVTPSRSGSQVMVSMERIPSPSRTGTPPVPPLPISQFLRKEEEKRQDEDIQMAYDTVSLTSPSPIRDANFDDRHMSAPHLQERGIAEEESRPRLVKSALLPDEPLRISSLEVGDLKVERLSVSQIEAHKIVASEVDALVIATSELRGGGSVEESLSPAIIKELIAIRSHLETVATSQARERYHESEKPRSREITDISIPDNDQEIPEPRLSQDCLQGPLQPDEIVSTKEPIPKEDREKPGADGEDQKVINTNVLDVRNKEVLHTSIVQAKDSLPLQTFAINQLESKDKDESNTTHLLTIAQDTQDKSLRILDSEYPLTLSSQTTSDSHMDESRVSFPPSLDVSTIQSPESGLSSEHRVDESTSISAQISAVEPITTTSTSPPDDKDNTSDRKDQIPRKSRSRSPSPCKNIVRQTASPVRSLPPVISVTPDTPDNTIPGRGISTDAQPQRAVISYSSDTEYNCISKNTVQSQRADISHSSGRLLGERQKESSQSSILPPNTTHFIAFPVSEIPAQFFSLSETPTSQRIDPEPGLIDITQQLLRALRSAGIKAMRHFVRYLTSTINTDNTREKIKEVELAICALLLLIAGLLIYYFSTSRTVTHYHHWDYFNPPQ